MLNDFLIALSIPPINGIHPFLVHLPLGLAPAIFLLSACLAITRSHLRGIEISVAILLLLITVGTYFTMETGEIAEKAVKIHGAAHHTLELHEKWAKRAFWLYLGTSIIFLPLLTFFRKRFGRFFPTAYFVLSTALLAGVLTLSMVGHFGGRLVHIHGIQAPIERGVSPVAE